MGESGRNSGKTLLCFALLCFCAHEQQCTHQMKLPQTKMLLRSQAVQHWHDRRWHAVAWLMGQAVQRWHCFRWAFSHTVSALMEVKDLQVAPNRSAHDLQQVVQHCALAR